MSLPLWHTELIFVRKITQNETYKDAKITLCSHW